MRKKTLLLIKEVVRSVIKEEVTRTPLIISARAPSPDDVYDKGTTWLHGKDKYQAKEVKIIWEKL